MENEYRKFLSSLGADEINHHDRSLSEHLIGTFRLLSKWGNSSEVAAAGAFHSIYGTEEFKTRAVSLERRSEIVALIGEDAEALVYLFGAADRRSFYDIVDGEPPFVTIPNKENERFEITEAQYKSLLELEAANIVDQAMHQRGVPDSVIIFWINAFRSKRKFLSAEAVAESEAVLADALARNAT